MKTQKCRKCGREFPLDIYHFFYSSNKDRKFIFTCKECSGVSFDTQLPFKEKPTKVCPKCNRELPRDDIHFYRAHTRQDGRYNYCKECQGHEFGPRNLRKTRLAEKDGYRVCSKCGKEFPLNKYFFHELKSSADGFAYCCRKCKQGSWRRKAKGCLSVDGMKKCSKCQEIKEVSMFAVDKRANDGLACSCLECARRYYRQNKHQYKKYHKKYFQNNKDSIYAHRQNKLKTDNNFKMAVALRQKLNIMVRKRGVKHANTLDLLGCDMDFFIKYIENQFTDGMAWNNYGRYGWHLDHYVPCSWFDLTDYEQQKVCFHYSNIQPMWAKDNLSKGAKYVG